MAPAAAVDRRRYPDARLSDVLVDGLGGRCKSKERTSALGGSPLNLFSEVVATLIKVRFYGMSALPPIVLQNSFWITEEKFCGLWVRRSINCAGTTATSNELTGKLRKRASGHIDRRLSLRCSFRQKIVESHFWGFATLSPQERTSSARSAMSEKCRYCCKSPKRRSS
jgi:hypothetical protein